MNSPPPVRFSVGRNPQWGRVMAGVWLLALLALFAALTLHAPARSNGPLLLAVLTAFILGMGLAVRLWRGQVSGALVWTGAEWLLEQDGAMTALTPPGIRFDGQRWLLLHTQAGRRAIWLWLGRSADPVRWHALRCALVAPAAPPLAAA